MTSDRASNQDTLGAWLAGLSPGWRVFVCLATSSSLAVFIPLLVLAIPGVTTHRLGQLNYNTYSILMVMAFGWLGFKFRRPWLFGGLLTFVFLGMWAFQALVFAPSGMHMKAILYGWSEILLAVSWPALQIYFFGKMMGYADPSGQPS